MYVELSCGSQIIFHVFVLFYLRRKNWIKEPKTEAKLDQMEKEICKHLSPENQVSAK